jgi:hypothetical protein
MQVFDNFDLTTKFQSFFYYTGCNKKSAFILTGNSTHQLQQCF